VGRLDGEEMNAARLTRRWQEAAGDAARMVEALADEISDPATGLVTRDFLRAELTQDRDASVRFGPEPRLGRTPQPGAAITSSSDLWRKVWIGLGVQALIVSAVTVILFQVLR
jgi:hypothetical protein